MIIIEGDYYTEYIRGKSYLFIKVRTWVSVAVCAYSPSLQKAEAVGSLAYATPGYTVKPCFKTNTNIRKKRQTLTLKANGFVWRD